MLASTILFLIVGCEIAFWVFLLGGLSARYMFQRERLSMVLLYIVPWIDVVLLLAVIVDLRAGSIATFAHGLAAAYIGFTVAFGRATLDWADRVFAHRFADGPELKKPPTFGVELFKYEMKWFGRCLLAVVITILLSYVAILLVGDASKTEAFQLWTRLPLITAGLWFVFGPVWSLVFYWRPSKAADESQS